jgi:uncharacterized protein (TIGR03435 family)
MTLNKAEFATRKTVNTAVAISIALLASVAAAAAQDVRFQTATMTRSESNSLSGGSRILPDGSVIISNTTVRDMLRIFYDVPDFAIVAAPEWFDSARFDIKAQAPANTARDGLKQMMRALLAEQLQLVLHQETRSLPVFQLRKDRADGTLGPNMNPAKISCETGGTAECPHDLTSGSFTAVAMPLTRIVRTLSELAGRPVIDKTSLSGLYDVKLTWIPDPSTFLLAVREQWGLRLEPQDETTQVLVIDRVEQLKAK